MNQDNAPVSDEAQRALRELSEKLRAPIYARLLTLGFESGLFRQLAQQDHSIESIVTRLSWQHEMAEIVITAMRYHLMKPRGHRSRGVYRRAVHPTAGGLVEELKEIIGRIFRDVVESSGGMLKAPLTDDVPLVHTGMDSLGFAVLVARLEETLGYDPFVLDDRAVYPQTYGEFVDAYSKFAGHRKQ